MIDNVSINISTTSDNMKASINISPKNELAEMPNLSELINELKQAGVVFGIKQSELDGIVKRKLFNESVCIAEGCPSVNGENSETTYFFNIDKDAKPTILEDGRVDYRNLDLIDSISKGKVLCTLQPPTKGVPGMNVYGQKLPFVDGKYIVLPKGKNVLISEDGLSLISNIDGQVTFADGKISVFSVHEVKADVDNSTGNINFIGNVIVRGNVLTGFSIEAGGNVEVWGVVEGASITAGGDIILRRGMQGLGKGTLKSSKDIIARYIENSIIEATHNIKSEAIMHSFVKCGNKLELAGKKGLLVGGICKVGKEVLAKVIGSHMATITEIEVGADPEMRERYKNLRTEIVNMENDIKKSEQAITILRKFEGTSAMTPDKQDMLTKSIRTKIFYTSKIGELKKEQEMLEERFQMDAFGKVKCSGYIYPGTKVSIGSCMLYARETLQYCTLYRDGADVRVGPLEK